MKRLFKLPDLSDKKVRLELFSAWGSDYQRIEFHAKRFAGILGAAAFLIVLLHVSVLLGSRWVFQEICAQQLASKQALLQTQFEQWQGRAEELARRYERSQGLPSGWTLTRAENADTAEALTGRGGAYIDEDDNVLPTFDAANARPDGNLYSANTMAASSSDFTEMPASDLIGRLESRISSTRQSHRIIFENFETRRQQLAHIPSVKPILSGRITDFFGQRVDPFVRRVRHHRGLDVAAPYGSEVYAPAAGTVELAKATYRSGRGYGRTVILDHGHGLKTLYGHLSKVRVKTGQYVQRWEVLGLVGATGRATGPHLHYEVWVDGKARDPVEFIINE
jgi:murein DD-endopeptidase MepM/ murein hydrolase activator NlpD